MDNSELESLAIDRIVVGYLGERDQFAWWQSMFFSSSASAFLAPVFAKTQLLAQASGVTLAAAVKHDERIGVGHVYHLFRLPEDIEQGIHRVLQHAEMLRRVDAAKPSKTTALDYLRRQAGSTGSAGVGPLRVGSVAELYDLTHWRAALAAYANGFEQKAEIYPYFSDLA
jgi:hypothetical protein